MKVHFIAIGGSAMHNLALALHSKGYQISGSDDEIFEPSKSRLSSKGLLPEKFGWTPDKINDTLDYIILGMHARPDNPELLRAQELGLKVYSYPEFIYEQCKTKTRVAIAGSHGKTSITAMILHVLHFHKMDCDFMVGAQLEGFDTMVQLTDHNEFVLLEADEYLSSPIDLRPKFLHYKPNIALISGISWDHYNVFPTYEDYYHQFDLFISSMESGGALIYNKEDNEVVKVTEANCHEIKKFAYGMPDYIVKDGEVSLPTPEGDVELSIFGRHNMNNLDGARWICNQMGLTDAQFYEAIPTFKGASNRLECVKKSERLNVYRDFAHAPSKVSATVNAVRENFPKAKFIACFELHTFSSLNIEFMDQYKGSLAAADKPMVYFNPDVVAHKKLPSLSVDAVQQKFNEPGLEVFENNQKLLQRIKEELASNEKVILLVMSSGNFDGIDWTNL